MKLPAPGRQFGGCDPGTVRNGIGAGTRQQRHIRYCRQWKIDLFQTPTGSVPGGRGDLRRSSTVASLIWNMAAPSNQSIMNNGVVYFLFLHPLFSKIVEKALFFMYTNGSANKQMLAYLKISLNNEG